VRQPQPAPQPREVALRVADARGAAHEQRGREKRVLPRLGPDQLVVAAEGVGE
jgi:hypothetical protein